VIKTEIDVTRAQLSRNGIEVLSGVASFTGPNSLRVSGSRGQQDYEAEKIIIATGTKPATSPLVLSTIATSLTATRFCKCRKFRKR